jgi:hypothetical protein
MWVRGGEKENEWRENTDDGVVAAELEDRLPEALVYCGRDPFTDLCSVNTNTERDNFYT